MTNKYLEEYEAHLKNLFEKPLTDEEKQKTIQLPPITREQAQMLLRWIYDEELDNQPCDYRMMGRISPICGWLKDIVEFGEIKGD